jgi:hypothetical protein
MISANLFKDNKVIVVDAKNATQKADLLDIIESITSETTIQDLEDMFNTNGLYYVIGDSGVEFEIVGSRPGTIKR